MAQRKIILRGKEITYNIRKSVKAKRMRMTLYHDGNLTITVPWFLNIISAEIFLRKKADWILKRIKSINKEDGIAAKTDPNEYYKLKERARALAQRKVDRFNRLYNFQYNRLAIRNQKTRWGSCSEKGNLNFNYKIVKLPEKLIDYIIVHELCHLQELNHSQKFWHLVEFAIPDYKERRREFRKLRII